MKRFIAFIMTALIIAAAGCEGDSHGGVEPAADDGTTGNNKTGTLTVCVNEYDQGLSLKHIFDMFEKEHPEIEVIYEIIPDWTSENYTPEMREAAISRIHTQLMAGKGPDIYIDLMHPYRNVNGTEFLADVQLAMRSGVFCDMKPYLESAGVNMDDFVAPVMEAGQIDGKQFVVPIHYDVSYMLTNDLTREIMGGDKAFDSTAAFVEGVAEILKTPEAMTETFRGWERWGSDITYCVNPLYLSSPVDYDTNTVNCDNEFVRKVLGDIKAIKDAPIEYNRSASEIDQENKKTREEFDEYVGSDKFAIISRYLGYNSVDAGYMEHIGLTPHVDPVPDENGEVQALITMYAAVRSNSEHKEEAAELIKLFLSEFSQKQTSLAGIGESLWPVRKGMIPTILSTMVGKNISCSSLSFDEPFFFERALSDETVAQFENIENSITKACFPLQSETVSILREYYAGERDIDSALGEMQSYLEMSLWAAD